VDYLDFVPAITEKGQIKTFIESDAGIQQQESKLMSVFAAWWQLHALSLGDLPKTKKVMELRAEFLSSFVDSLQPVGLLDRFKVAGVVASWWDEVKYELRTLSESNFGGLIDSWVDTIRDALEQDDDDVNKTKFDPLNHKLVVRLMPDYLAEFAEAEANIAELEQQKEAFERGEEVEDVEETEEDCEQVNLVKELEERLKKLKISLKEKKEPVKSIQELIKQKQRRVNYLNRGASVKDQGSIAAQKKLGNDTKFLEDELKQLGNEIVNLETELKNIHLPYTLSLESEINEIEQHLEPYYEIKKQLTQAKANLRTLKNELVSRLEAARQALTDEQCQDLVLEIFKDGLIAELERYVTAHRQQVIVAVEIWWDKYRVNLKDIEAERDTAAKRLSEFLKALGYAG